MRERLRPTLERIAFTGETAFVAVPSGDELYYLDAIESPHRPRVASPAGRRERLEGSAPGLVFLATMPGLRKRVMATRNAIGPGSTASRCRTVSMERSVRAWGSWDPPAA